MFKKPSYTRCNFRILLTRVLKTLFNIVEERFKKLLNFDVSAVHNDVQKGQ